MEADQLRAQIAKLTQQDNETRRRRLQFLLREALKVASLSEVLEAVERVARERDQVSV
jgi:hypothetical protein